VSSIPRLDRLRTFVGQIALLLDGNAPETHILEALFGGEFCLRAGQATPVHDHTVWGLIGVLRGAEIAHSYRTDEAGALIETSPAKRLDTGAVDAVSPQIGDIHRVSNAYPDRTSISIHVYGANIGAVTRSVYPLDGGRKTFISGYANDVLPNIWNVSKELLTP
jgi:3-mercaptopropionate dioxygenase